MKYCSNCRGILERKPNHHFHCKSCEADYYTNPKACSAGFVLLPSNMLALAVRAREPHAGLLDCPGGFLDVGENFEEALYRELLEETGITKNDIKSIDFLTTVYDDYPWRPVDIPVSTVYYVVRLNKNIKFTPADDVAEIINFEINRIIPEEFAWVGMKIAFKKLKANL